MSWRTLAYGTWAPAAEQFERWSRSMSGDGPFLSERAVHRAPGAGKTSAMTQDRHPGHRGARGRGGRFETAAPTRRSPCSRSSSPKSVRAASAGMRPSCSALAVEARLLGPFRRPRPRRPRSGRRPSPSPANRARARSSYVRRCRSRSSIIRSAVLSKPTTSSPPRSKASRRRRNFLEVEEAPDFSHCTPETDEVKNAAAFRNGLLEAHRGSNGPAGAPSNPIWSSNEN